MLIYGFGKVNRVDFCMEKIIDLYHHKYHLI